jgi:hypothetical protein
MPEFGDMRGFSRYKAQRHRRNLFRLHELPKAQELPSRLNMANLEYGGPVI